MELDGRPSLSWAGPPAAGLEIGDVKVRRNTWDNANWVVDSRTPFVRKGEQSVTGGVFILCNVTIGLAVLNMPYTFKLAGPMMVLVMLFVGGISTFTGYLVFKSIELTAPLAESRGIAVENRDWGHLAEVAYGEHGRVAAEFCFRGELVAYILSFLCTLGVHLHLLFPVVSIEQGVIISSLASLLMSYLPPTVLGKVALFAHLAYLVVAACLYYSSFAALGQPGAPRVADLARDNWGRVGAADALRHLPTVFEACVYSWAGHSILPSVAGSMVEPLKVKQVIFISFPVAVGTCMFVGVTGYLLLGPYTEQVFTENLAKVYWLNPEGDIMESLLWMRVLAAASVTVKLGATVPCWLLPLLVSTEAGIRRPSAKLLWRACLILAMGLVACVFKDQVVIAVALAGATFGNALVFILPCTVYYGVKRRLGRVGAAEAAMLAAIVLMGCLLMVYGVYDCGVKLLEG